MLAGNPSGRPLNSREPTPPADNVQPPAWLTVEERGAWAEISGHLAPLGLLTVADTISLGMLCDLLVRYKHTKAALDAMSADDPQTYGTMLKTRDGNAIQNPMVGALNKLRQQLSRELANFGMNPSSRSVIGVDVAAPDPIMKKYGLTG